MTAHTATTTIDVESDRARAKRAAAPLAGAVAVVAGILSAVNAEDLTEAAIELPIILLTTALVYGLVVRRGLRATSAGGRAIILDAVGLLVLLPAFWSGLPLILGSAGALLGYAGKRAETGATKAMVAFVLGLLVCVGYVAFYVGDMVNTHTIG
jgi:hypothetical protein